MVTDTRWRAAQQYERDYWDGLARKMGAGLDYDLTFYQWRAQQLVKRLDEAGLSRLTDGSARIIEIGSGPVGVAGFFPASRRVAVDPLNDAYASNPQLSALRSAEVQYHTAPGERLPVEDAAFDLAIIENCIDHVRDTTAVMNEIRRVLVSDSVLYLTVNCRSRLGYPVHRALSRLRLDPGHPHTFTPNRLRRFIAHHGFELAALEVGSWLDAWRADLRSEARRDRIKALLGVSEYVATVLARKRNIAT